MMPIVVDVETAPHPDAEQYVEPLTLEGIKPDARLKDPEKIDLDLKAKHAKAAAEYEEMLDRASLDWNLCRIVSLAWTLDGGVTMHGDVCRDEAREADVLMQFWSDVEMTGINVGWGNLRISGFCARTFDLPVIIQRSRLLNLKVPHVNIAPYGRGQVIDLYDVLTFDNTRATAIMPRSLTMFCRRFGIPSDDEIAGAEIPGLVAAGEWDSIWAHNVSDVKLTALLAKRLRLLDHEPVDVF